MNLLLRIESVDVPNNAENRQVVKESIEKFLDWRFTHPTSNAVPLVARRMGTKWRFVIEEVTSELPLV